MNAKKIAKNGIKIANLTIYRYNVFISCEKDGIFCEIIRTA